MTLVKIVETIASICSIAMAIYGIYFVLIGLNFSKNKEKHPEAKVNHKFAVLIAARNEEQVIGDLIESLKNQDYPSDKYDIYVMPNNCTDDTKAVSISHGAKIFEPVGPIRNKGDVLNQTFEYLMAEEDHEAYLVFDADNIVDKNYIKEMNKSLDSGNEVAIGFRDSKNPSTSFMSGAYTIYYLLVSTFYNKARSNIGMNALITGTGFMTSRKNLERLGGWNTQSITEDIEFTMQNSVAGTHIDYVPSAITFDEQPNTLEQSWHQRLRWSKGSIQAFKLMKKDLVKAAFNNKGKNSIDMLLMLIAAYVQLFSVFAIGVSIFAVFLLKTGLIKYLGTLIISGLLAQALLSIFAIVVNKKSILKLWKGIVSFWVLTVTWIPIQILAISMESVEWKEIKHTTIKEI